MKKPIFQNPAHQQLFEKQGFIVLPFLTSEEVSKLDLLFDELHPNINQSGFFSGSYSKDFDYKKKASDAIVATFSRAYSELFVDYTPFGGAFLYKVPGADSELAAHQDWTIVDEKENVALNCWVPLCDVSLQNGPLMVLPGSQFDKLNVIRSPTLPFFYSGDDDMVIKELEIFEVKAGTAIILNQSVIHYSPPNNGTQIRKAITAGVKTKDAQMYFHYKIPDSDELEVFEMDDDFLIRFDNFMEDLGKRPYLGKSIATIPYKLPQFKGEVLYDVLKKMKTDAGFAMKSKAPEAAIQESSSASPAQLSIWEKLKAFLTT